MRLCKRVLGNKEFYRNVSESYNRTVKVGYLFLIFLSFEDLTENISIKIFREGVLIIIRRFES